MERAFGRPACCAATELKLACLLWLILTLEGHDFSNFYLMKRTFVRPACCAATELEWCRGARGRHPQLLQGRPILSQFFCYQKVSKWTIVHQNAFNKIVHFFTKYFASATNAMISSPRLQSWSSWTLSSF